MGGVMDQIKKARDIEKRTSIMQQELSDTFVTGTSADGGVTVQMSAQQKPCLVEFSDEYYEKADKEQVGKDVLAAIGDAHQRALKVMTKKMNALYKDLGMPGAVPIR
jgi:DNA-binding protein YbaB